jgi:threonine dehydrogenase-like Zn-dependent dehydrogenase
VVAIAVSVSFAIASPFTSASEAAYQRLKPFWDRFQSGRVHPNDQMIDTGDARVLIIGMGRVGTGAYDELSKTFGNRIIGIEHDEQRAVLQRSRGRNVLVGDATDTDFWNKLRLSATKELIVLAMPSHNSNVFAAQQIRSVGINCQVVAIAKFAEEVEELASLDVPSFNMYSEAGSGLARHAMEALSIRGGASGF